MERRNSYNDDSTKERKHMQTIETGLYNKQYFLEKEYKRRQQHEEVL